MPLISSVGPTLWSRPRLLPSAAPPSLKRGRGQCGLWVKGRRPRGGGGGERERHRGVEGCVWRAGCSPGAGRGARETRGCQGSLGQAGSQRWCHGLRTGSVAGSGERSGHVCETLHVASLTDTCRFLGWSLQTELSIQARPPVCPPSRPRWPDWALGGGQAGGPQPLAT